MVNGQGDVVKLLHGSNKTVAEYTYDAYGNILTVSPAQSDDPTIAAQNPLRYRGYYCDTETGFYYLQSRYYGPAVRRFLNADSYGSTGQGLLGYNMFAYGNNDPAMFIDLNGSEPSETIDTDGDGEPDFYVYNYSTEKVIILDYGFHYSGLGYSSYLLTPYLTTVTVSGRIFITSYSEEPPFPDDFGSNDILVLDNRNHLNANGNPDPAYRVYNSYTISGTAQQREILNAIFDYDSCFPSKYKWNHNMSTALKEWDIHNFAYIAYSILNLLGDYSKKLKSCAHVDLDNDDIGKGILDYLKR